MKVKIENHTKKKIFWFNIDRTVSNLLKFIPNEHLIGLGKISIVDEIKYKKKKKAAGLYSEKNGRTPAIVELSVKSIYKGMPKILFLLPFIAKFSLANVLFHEIGHHYHQKFKHEIDKGKKENFAEDYKKSMLKRAFWGWMIILRPISPIVKWLAKIVNH